MQMGWRMGVFLAASFLSFCSSNAYTPLPRRTEQTYQYWKEKCKTPELIKRFFDQETIKYTADEVVVLVTHTEKKITQKYDYMQAPIDTYLRGLGDCEDYAALASDWLASHGYETMIIQFDYEDKDDGHAVCAVKEGGKWSYLGNDGYRKGYRTIDELVESENPEWTAYEIVVPEEAEENGRRVIKKVKRKKTTEPSAKLLFQNHAYVLKLSNELSRTDILQEIQK